MDIPVLLSIRSEQRYEGQQADLIELTTEGVLSRIGENAWRITYEESALTGLEGVQTNFRVQPNMVHLERTGALQSVMEFEENVRHDSLYQMDFGALMIGIVARKIKYEINEQGGYLDVFYDIQIEQNQAGSVSYHVGIQVKA